MDLHHTQKPSMPKVLMGPHRLSKALIDGTRAEDVAACISAKAGQNVLYRLSDPEAIAPKDVERHVEVLRRLIAAVPHGARAALKGQRRR
eukprot:5255142-Alexandrium_andersonii.AAC.1